MDDLHLSLLLVEAILYEFAVFLERERMVQVDTEVFDLLLDVDAFELCVSSVGSVVLADLEEGGFAQIDWDFVVDAPLLEDPDG